MYVVANWNMKSASGWTKISAIGDITTVETPSVDKAEVKTGKKLNIAKHVC